MYRYLNSATKKTEYAVQNLAVIALMLAALLYFTGVVLRYIFSKGIPWIEELCRYMVVWITYFGVSLNILDVSHTRITLIEDVFPITKKKLNLIQDIFVFIYMILITYFGMKNMAVTSTQNSPNMQIPMNIVYIGIPIGCFIGTLFSISNIVKYFKKENGGRL